MSDLPIVPLGDLVKVKGGKRLPKGSNLQTIPNDHPYIRVRDMGQRYIPDIGLEYVPDEVFPKIQRYIVEENDVIISIVGTIGLVSVIDDRFHLASQTENCAKLSGLDRNDALYVYYYLSSNIGQQSIKEATVGAVQAKLPLYNIEKIPVIWPERKERELIVSNLSSLDDKIELNRQINQTLEQIAQAIFKSWFVDFEPVKAKIQAKQNGQDPERAAMRAISGKTDEELDQLSPEQRQQLTHAASLFPGELEDSELGEIPESWRASKLGEVAENHSTTFNFKAYEEVVFVNTGDVLEGDFLHKNYSSKQGLPGQAKKSIKRDDILFSEIRPKNKRYAYVNFDPDEYVVSTKFMIIRGLGEVHPRYLYQILKQNKTIQEFNIIAESRSGTFPQITFDSISQLPVIVPSNEIQSWFMEFFQPIISNQENILKQESVLSDLRDTLLPKLLSGKIIQETTQFVAEAAVG